MRRWGQSFRPRNGAEYVGELVSRRDCWLPCFQPAVQVSAPAAQEGNGWPAGVEEDARIIATCLAIGALDGLGPH